MESAWPVTVAPNICETCGNEPMVGVFGLTQMSASARICEKCLAQRAEPFSWLRRLVAVAAVSGVRDAAAHEDWLHSVKTFIEGEYLTVGKALQRYPITREELAKYQTKP